MANTYDTTRGINAKGITQMQSAINSYKSKLVKSIGEVLQYSTYATGLNKAIKGNEFIKTVEKGFTSVNKSATEIISQLDKFSSALDKIESEYKKTHRIR